VTAWVSERVNRGHELDSFDCGVTALNAWLRRDALRADRQNTARTYVWTQENSTIVRAYYAIAPTTVRKTGVPRSVRGGHTNLPSYLLARLALDQSLQGRGLGAALLLDALRRVDGAVAQAGGRLLVVDAASAAAADLCRHFGFVQIGDSNRCHLRASVIRMLLAQSP
jgi:GNAT superfamily N-acetyltransferase